MKVLQLNAVNDPALGGGSSVAVYRLHLALRGAEVDSKLLCRFNRVGSPLVIVTTPSPLPQREQ